MNKELGFRAQLTMVQQTIWISQILQNNIHKFLLNA